MRRLLVAILALVSVVSGALIEQRLAAVEHLAASTLDDGFALGW